jgi:hypothetical protein
MEAWKNDSTDGAIAGIARDDRADVATCVDPAARPPEGAGGGRGPLRSAAPVTGRRNQCRSRG